MENTAKMTTLKTTNPTPENEPSAFPAAERPVEQPKPQNTQTGGARNANVFETIFVIGNLLPRIAVIFVLLFGAIRFFSQSLHPVRAVELVIGIFQIRRGNIYVTLISAAVAVLYFAFLIITAKNTVFAIKHAVGLWRKSAPNTKRTLLISLYQLTRNDILLAVVLAAICALFSGSSPYGGFYVPIVLFLLDYVVTDLLLFIQRNLTTLRRKDSVWKLIAKTIRFSLTIAFACLAAQYLFQPSGLNLFYGFNGLIHGGAYNSIFDFFFKPILDLILALLYLKLLPDLFYVGEFYPSNTSTNDTYIKSALKRFLILLVVSALAACIFYAVFNAGVRFNISILADWFRLLKLQYLPLLFFSVAYFVLVSQSDAPLTAPPNAAPERAA